VQGQQGGDVGAAIAHAMVIGDRRPYVTALLTLDPEGITHWALMNAKQDTPLEHLATDPDLRSVLQRAVDEANRLVSRPESIRRFTVVPGGFTEEEGHLTPSMKLRREVVERSFTTEIEGLYEK
nr:long-chain fatty acid--CoA ligase [Streptomyces europaeiscabiei]